MRILKLVLLWLMQQLIRAAFKLALREVWEWLRS
jgi:hypothetical protein